jgi:hypothetical protein
MRFSMHSLRSFSTSIKLRFQQRKKSKSQFHNSRPEQSPVPKSSQEAHTRLNDILAQNATIRELSHEEFMLGWVALAYIAPALDPDDAATEDGGWSPGWQLIAAEAFRRFATKELTKDELYPRPF